VPCSARTHCDGSIKYGILIIVIVVSEFIESHSKVKRTRAPAYSRALRRIRGVVQRIIHGRLRYDFQRVRGDRVAVKVGVV